ncbi:MAG: hypothetical protein FWB91_09485 [Defluviitaleaceae bacterium]|nr:hypothetical protein [Defluviitaleaceae bacterium]
MKKWGYITVAIVGALGLTLGTVAGIVLSQTQLGSVSNMAFIAVGVGAGLLGVGLAGIINARILKKNPGLAKQKEIDVNDERNISLGNKAKAKAFSFTCYLYSALVLFFVAMDTGPLIFGSLIAANLASMFVFIFFLTKYHKEM